MFIVDALTGNYTTVKNETCPNANVFFTNVDGLLIAIGYLLGNGLFLSVCRCRREYVLCESHCITMNQFEFILTQMLIVDSITS